MTIKLDPLDQRISRYPYRENVTIEFSLSRFFAIVESSHQTVIADRADSKDHEMVLTTDETMNSSLFIHCSQLCDPMESGQSTRKFSLTSVSWWSNMNHLKN